MNKLLDEIIIEKQEWAIQSGSSKHCEHKINVMCYFGEVYRCSYKNCPIKEVSNE